MHTVADAIDHVLAALADLELRGEAIADEWQYVADLVGAWTARLRLVREGRGGEALAAGVGAAIAAACAAAARIEDQHRAIDWLSTLPQLVLVALDERP